MVLLFPLVIIVFPSTVITTSTGIVIIGSSLSCVIIRIRGRPRGRIENFSSHSMSSELKENNTENRFGRLTDTKSWKTSQ
jgi:hypothetical protein